MLPLINRIGVGWANTFAAALVTLGFAIVVFTIRYGQEMREKGCEWGLVAAGMEERLPVPPTLSTDSTVVVERGEKGGK
jgi:hypothetical protein